MQRIVVQQVVQLLIVNLQEAAFYYELSLGLSFVDFLKNKPINSWYDSQILLA